MIAATHNASFAEPPLAWRDRWREAHDRWWFDLYFEPLISTALPHLELCLSTGGRLLHLGSGIGDKTDALRRLGARVTGLEIARDLVAVARRTYPQTNFVEGDATAIPFPDRSFDAVFSFSLLQCLDWRRLLAEARRVLKPRGRAVFIENLAGSPFARVYRLGRKALGLPRRRFQTPIDYLRWDDRSELALGFRSATFAPFHLCTPLLLAWPAIRMHAFREVQMHVAPSRLFRALSSLDRTLLNKRPALASHAWKLVALLEA